MKFKLCKCVYKAQFRLIYMYISVATGSKILEPNRNREKFNSTGGSVTMQNILKNDKKINKEGKVKYIILFRR